MSSIELVNNFDGVHWYGVFADGKLVWTGTEDSCKSYSQVLENRANHRKVLNWREMRQYGISKRYATRWIDDGKPFECVG